jgi:hypothetical protein
MTIYQNNTILLNSFKYFQKKILNKPILNKKRKKNLKKQTINDNNLCYIKQITKNKKFFINKTNSNFENEFKDLRKKIFQYINNDLKKNYLIPSSTKVYIPIEKSKNEILLSRQSFFNYYDKQLSKNIIKSEKTYYICESSYLEMLIEMLINDDIFFQLQRRFRTNFIKSIKKYNNLLHNRSIEANYFSKENQNLKPISIILGFLEKSDAIIYKKRIINDSFYFSIRKKKIKIEKSLEKNKNILTILLNRMEKYFLIIFKIKKDRKLIFLLQKIIINFIRIFKIKKRIKEQTDQINHIKNNLEFSIKIKPTTISGIKNSLKLFKNLKKTKLINTFIIVPKFFNYNYVPKQEKFIYFPNRMLTKFGFRNVPIYKTKQIEKKLLLSYYSNSEKITIPLKYLKTKTFFTTLNKHEYEKLAKKDNKKLLFYEEEKEFTDVIKNLTYNQNKNFLNQFLEILLKIKNKTKTIKKLKLIKDYFHNNYYENNLLEKINFYIDKIN